MEKLVNRIEEKLADYIVENCLPKNNSQFIEYDKNLFDAGIVDSAGLVSFISYIEVEFNISVPDEDLLPENFVSINAIAHYIRKQQKVTG
jgi:acyl carrier protein